MPEETKEHTEVKASPAPAAAAVTTPPVAGSGGGSAGAAGAAKADEHKAAAPAESKTVSIGDDEYEVSDDGYVKIPATAFKKRLNRYSKAQLKDAFGTDNIEDIKLRLDEHGKLKAKADEDHKKTLATEERLQLERDNEKKLRIAAESKAEKLAEEREYREADHSVNETASRHVDAKFTDFAAYKFGCYVRELDDDEAGALKPKDVAVWFKQFAADHPEYAIGAKPAGAAADDKPKVKKPMEHGAGGGVAPPPAPATGGKTPRPGQPNSMNAEEYRQWKKDQGIRA